MAYRTTSKRPTGATPFVFTYRIKAIISIKIGMSTAKIVVQYQMNNDEELIKQLDWADELRGDVTIRITSYHQRAIAHYNKRHDHDFSNQDL